MAWQDTSADAVRCVRIISREVPACTVPDVSFLYMASVASLAQLVEHALRKRMVVGSIPRGGLRCCSAMEERKKKRPGPSFSSDIRRHCGRTRTGALEIEDNDGAASWLCLSSSDICLG